MAKLMRGANDIAMFAGLAIAIQQTFRESNQSSRNTKSGIGAVIQLYFNPDGILDVPASTCENRSFDDNKAREILFEFNQVEPFIESAIMSLERLMMSGNPSASEQRTIERVRYNQIVVRQKVKEVLNERLTFGSPGYKGVENRPAFFSLLPDIKGLNRIITGLDASMRGEQVI